MQKATSTGTAKNLSNVIKINEDHLGTMVRSTVEETLNDMLDAEADQLCNAKRPTYYFKGGLGNLPRLHSWTFLSRLAP